jgi:hypothetical protein
MAKFPPIAEFEKMMKEVVEYYMSFMVKRAQLNAPIFKNVLRPGISYKPVRRNYRGAWRMDLIASAVNPKNGYDYAFYMHEGEYNLGKKSASQPPTREGGVGNKFLSRVMEYWFREKYFEQLYAQRFEELLIKQGFTKK